MGRSGYPAIGDYALIGDGHTAALVSRSASVDWWCLPRFDGGACFARLLDWDRGGHCSLEPVAEYRSSRRYLDGTLVLETRFEAPGGEARLIDCLPVFEDGGAGLRSPLQFNVITAWEFFEHIAEDRIEGVDPDRGQVP